MATNRQYDRYRRAVQDCHITQSMHSDGGRCHDNARCESMWASIKSELLYERYDIEKMTVTDETCGSGGFIAWAKKRGDME